MHRTGHKNRRNYKWSRKVFELSSRWSVDWSIWLNSCLGGVMGRFPYVKRVVHGATPREPTVIGCIFTKWNWPCSRQKAKSITCKVLSIPQIGTSFGSKHLYFWGGYPVLDTRMWTLFGHKEQIPYDLYLTEIDSISQSWGVSWSTAERALFGFSSHYFVNSELRFKKNIGANHIDEEVAKDLVRLSSQWIISNSFRVARIAHEG